MAQQLSPQREELSADSATTAMRVYNERAGEEVFTKTARDTVEEMIEATKVVGRTDTGLVQNASSDRLVGAVLADPDLSSLGRQDGVLDSLGLYAEGRWLQGHVAPPANGTLRALPLTDVDGVAEFLADQQKLFKDHQYLLERSRELFPHQVLNSGRVGELHRGVVAGQLDWPAAVDRADGWARGESRRRPARADRGLPGRRRAAESRRNRRPGGRTTRATPDDDRNWR